MSEDRGQMTDVRGQRAEVRGQRTEDARKGGIAPMAPGYSLIRYSEFVKPGPISRGRNAARLTGLPIGRGDLKPDGVGI